MKRLLPLLLILLAPSVTFANESDKQIDFQFEIYDNGKLIGKPKISTFDGKDVAFDSEFYDDNAEVAQTYTLAFVPTIKGDSVALDAHVEAANVADGSKSKQPLRTFVKNGNSKKVMFFDVNGHKYEINVTAKF